MKYIVSPLTVVKLLHLNFNYFYSLLLNENYHDGLEVVLRAITATQKVKIGILQKVKFLYLLHFPSCLTFV